MGSYHCVCCGWNSGEIDYIYASKQRTLCSYCISRLGGNPLDWENLDEFVENYIKQKESDNARRAKEKLVCECPACVKAGRC